MMKQPALDLTLIYTRIVERYADFFPRPEARLRFFNGTIARQVSRQKKIEQSLKRFSFIERTPMYRWLMESMFHRAVIEELSGLLPSRRAERKEFLRGAKVSLGARLFFLFYRLRYPLYGVGLGLVALLLVGMYFTTIWAGRQVNQYLAQKYGRSGGGQSGVIAYKIAQYLPGFDPDKVWLVKEDKEAKYELYSNGARILTQYETDNHARNYYLYTKNDPRQNSNLPVQHDIVGILYHTTESELVEFKSDNNDDLLRHTQGLLGWVQKKKSYNYVIDRIGQIHRVIRDEHAADHAGHSIWNDDNHTYVFLNESFLGIAFETKGESLTEAQVVAGRQLTAILRSKYNIRDVNCTTHGLVSFSPNNMVIGYHHDWAHNFPFEAMGLSDKYAVPPTHVSTYGCVWEEEIVTKMGGSLWAGVKVAETEFEQRAARFNLRPEVLRQLMKERYSEQLEVNRKLRDSNGSDSFQATNKAESIETGK
jgi:hypothetical protein